MTWQARSAPCPRPWMAPVWCMLAGRASSHVGHTGHLSGCSLTAPRPLFGSRGCTVEMDLELVLLNSTFTPTTTDPQSR